MEKQPKYFYMILIISLLPALLSGCMKETEIRKQSIRISDPSGMIINDSARTITGMYNRPQTIKLDVNRDGIPDLSLTANIIGSPGMGQHPHASIQALHHELGFLGFLSKDTTYVNENIMISQDGNLVYHQTTFRFNCQKLSPFYNFYSTAENFHLKTLEPNDELQISNLFASDTVSFIYSWNSPIIPYFANDTVFTRQSYTNFSCFALPYNTDIYLGYNVLIDSNRLGWLKIRINSSSSLTLLEWAIQS